MRKEPGKSIGWPSSGAARLWQVAAMWSSTPEEKISFEFDDPKFPRKSMRGPSNIQREAVERRRDSSKLHPSTSTILSMSGTWWISTVLCTFRTVGTCRCLPTRTYTATLRNFHSPLFCLNGWCLALRRYEHVCHSLKTMSLRSLHRLCPAWTSVNETHVGNSTVLSVFRMIRICRCVTPGTSCSLDPRKLSLLHRGHVEHSIMVLT